jgi:tetratricopeptide (TPR) repeat protein
VKQKGKICGLCLVSIIIISTTLVFAQPEENTTELFNKGMEMEHANDFPKALSYFDKILETDPNNVKTLIEKSNTLYSLGKNKEALDVLNKTLEIEPNNVSALVNKGIILTIAGKYDEASKYINKTLEIEPNNVRALTDQGIIFSIKHKYRDAIVVLNKALSIDPTNLDAIRDRLDVYNSIGTSPVTPKSNFTLYLQVEIQNSAGQMVAYIESPQSLLQYLNDTGLVYEALDAQNVTQTITKNGKKYDVIQIREYELPNGTGFNGVDRLYLNATHPVMVFLGQLHGYSFEQGDFITQLWTVTRPHR